MADTNKNRGQTVNSAESAVKSITQMTGPGAGDSLTVYGYRVITCQLTVAGMTGAGTQVIRMEGSQDGTNWAPVFQVDPYNPVYDSTGVTTIAGDITIVWNGTYLIPTIEGNIQYIRPRVVNETDTYATYDMTVIAQD